MNPDAMSAKGRKASYIRAWGPDDPRSVAASRELAAINIRHFAADQIANAPGLTPEDARDLAALILRGAVHVTGRTEHVDDLAS